MKIEWYTLVGYTLLPLFGWLAAHAARLVYVSPRDVADGFANVARAGIDWVMKPSADGLGRSYRMLDGTTLHSGDRKPRYSSYRMRYQRGCVDCGYTVLGYAEWRDPPCCPECGSKKHFTSTSHSGRWKYSSRLNQFLGRGTWERKE